MAQNQQLAVPSPGGGQIIHGNTMNAGGNINIIYGNMLLMKNMAAETDIPSDLKKQQLEDVINSFISTVAETQGLVKEQLVSGVHDAQLEDLALKVQTTFGQVQEAKEKMKSQRSSGDLRNKDIQDLIHALWGQRETLKKLNKDIKVSAADIDVIIQTLRQQLANDSGSIRSVSSTLSYLSLDDETSWRGLRVEFQKHGMSPGQFDANRELISKKLQAEGFLYVPQEYQSSSRNQKPVQQFKSFFRSKDRELRQACSRGDPHDVRHLLDYKANINSSGRVAAKTPLIIAVEHSHREIVQLLIQRRADKDKPDRSGCTPLVYAVKSGNYEITELLLQNGVEINKADKSGLTPLCHAIEQDKMEIAVLLLQWPLDINQGSPLVLAIEKKHSDIVQTLMSRPDLDINQTDGKGNNALSIAVRWQDESLVHRVLHRNPQIDRVAVLLEESVKLGNVKIAKALLEKGAEVEPSDHDDKGIAPFNKSVHDRSVGMDMICKESRALYLAVENSDEAMTQLLLMHGAQVTTTGSELHLAARIGNAEIVKLLIDDGGDANGQRRGETPLWIAVVEGHTRVAELLLEHGADPNTRVDTTRYCSFCAKGSCLFTGLDGVTVLKCNIVQIAVAHGHRELARMLSGKGADPNAWVECKPLTSTEKSQAKQNIYRGKKMLHIAAIKPGRAIALDAVQLLSELGVRRTIDDPDSEQRTALHLAAKGDGLENDIAEKMVRQLLQEHASVKMVNSILQTPLHVAAENGQLAIAKILIEASSPVNSGGYRDYYYLAKKASLNAQDSEGQSPLHYAAKKGDAQLYELLVKAGCDRNLPDKIGATPEYLRVKASGTSVRVRRGELVYPGDRGWDLGSIPGKKSLWDLYY
ncbi:ankyrin repeat-containing domain protein [Xylaria sp. FL0933]|nr:ankyrin repeat-containing domain protein [Xylaria sp. FL0933]